MRAPPAELFVVDDLRFEQHEADGPHPERPERLRALRSGLIEPLRAAGAQKLEPREARDEELLRVHSPEHVAGLANALRSGAGYLDEDTFYSRGSREATWLAAGSAAELSRVLLSRPSAAGVLGVRPPGHHATRTRAMGFCLINNVAVAAAHALAQGLSRVAVVDWDVHHGNGTQAIFEDDPRVLMVSLHQWPLYPGTGRSEEIGTGPGRGFTVNLPLPAQSGGATYRAAMEQVVEPVLTQFRPELVLVSAGFDAHADDPLGGMLLQDQDYGALTARLWRSMGGFGCDKLGLVLEGGYDLGALERSGHAMAQALLGERCELDEAPCPAHAQQAIDATRRALKTSWQV